jgi:hypothetical protein
MMLLDAQRFHIAKSQEHRQDRISSSFNTGFMAQLSCLCWLEFGRDPVLRRRSMKLLSKYAWSPPTSG